MTMSNDFWLGVAVGVAPSALSTSVWLACQVVLPLCDAWLFSLGYTIFAYRDAENPWSNPWRLYRYMAWKMPLRGLQYWAESGTTTSITGQRIRWKPRFNYEVLK